MDLIHSLWGFTLSVRVSAIAIKRCTSLDTPACQERAAFHLSRSDVTAWQFEDDCAPKLQSLDSLSADFVLPELWSLSVTD